MPLKVAALPRQVLEPRLYATGAPAPDIGAMLRSDEWCALQPRNQQLLFIDDCLEDECNIAPIAATIGNTFLIEGSHVRTIRSMSRIKPKAAHGPLALTGNAEAAIARLIREGNSSRNYVTQRDLLNFVEVQFEQCLTHRWIDSVLHIMRKSSVKPPWHHRNRSHFKFTGSFWMTPLNSSKSTYLLFRPN
jgi:hypothetical protein